ncbi:MAG: hypothetical protein WCA91_00775 [Candidatus Acidiferrales bacterium]
MNINFSGRNAKGKYVFGSTGIPMVVSTRRAHSEMENDLHKLSWDIAHTLESQQL